MEEHGEHSASTENESAQETGGSSAEPRERCPACGFMNEAGADTCAQCEQRLMPADIKPGVSGLTFVHTRTAETSEASERPVAADEHAHEEPPMDSRAGPPPATGAESPARQLQGNEFRYVFAPTQETVTLKLAGLIRRALALIVDWVLINLLALGLMYAAGAGEQLAELTSLLETQGWQVLGSENLASGVEAVLTAMGLVQLLVAVGMYTLFIYYGGSTPGMLISGIRVTRADGADVSFAMSFLRGTVFWLFIFFTMGLYLLVGALYTFLDPRGRAIHDVLTDTNVYLRNSSS